MARPLDISNFLTEDDGVTFPTDGGGGDDNPPVVVDDTTVSAAFAAGLIVTRTPNATVVGAFPTTPQLDDFSTTVGALSSAPWGTWSAFAGAHPLVSDGAGNCTSSGVLCGSYRTDVNAVHDVEIEVLVDSMGGADNITLGVRVGTPASAGWTGYRIKWQNGNVAVYRSDGTALGNTNFTFAAGDAFGVRMIGTALICEHNQTPVFTVNDATFSTGTIAVAISSPTAVISSIRGGAAATSTSGGAYGETATIYVPPPTGIAATDTPNIQGALTTAGVSGAIVEFAPGKYVVNQTLTISSHQHWNGAGKEATIIFLATGSNCDLVQTAGWASLHTTTTAGGAYAFSIKNMTLDQNGYNQSSTIGTYVLRIYGFYYTLENLKCDNGNWGGVTSEWSEAGALSGQSPLSLSDVTKDGYGDVMESVWTNVHVNNYTGPPAASQNITYGVYFNGPHDSKWSGVFISSFRSNHQPFNGTVTCGLYLGAATLAIEIVNLHIYGRHTHSLYGPSRCVYLANPYIESGTIASITLGSQWSIVGGSILGTNSQILQPNETGITVGDDGAITGNTISSFGSQVYGMYIENYNNLAAVGGVPGGPLALAAAAPTSGGAFAAGTYFWKVTAVDARGETLGSNEVTASPTSNQQVALTWTAVTNAVSYNVYRATSAGAESTSPSLVANVLATSGATYTDTGSAVGTGAVPATNTTGGRAVRFLNSSGGNVIKLVTSAPPSALYLGTPNVADTVELIPQSFLGSALMQAPAGNPTSAITIYTDTTTNGTFRPPVGAKVACVTLISGGCGGDSGDVRPSGTASVGGDGGGGGAMTQAVLPASAVNGATMTVGAGGAGAAAIATTNTAGSAGTAGGLTRFGSQAQCTGATRPTGGLGTVPGGAGTLGAASGIAGSQPTASAAAGGGGPGGGITTGSAVANGTTGGAGNSGMVVGGTGGAGAGPAGGAHNVSGWTGGGGGAGGAASLTTAFAGGAGGLWGGGGGGGGAAQDGGTSGAGGKGGDGAIIVTTY